MAKTGKCEAKHRVRQNLWQGGPATGSAQLAAAFDDAAPILLATAAAEEAAGWIALDL